MLLRASPQMQDAGSSSGFFKDASFGDLAAPLCKPRVFSGLAQSECFLWTNLFTPLGTPLQQTVLCRDDHTNATLPMGECGLRLWCSSQRSGISLRVELLWLLHLRSLVEWFLRSVLWRRCSFCFASRILLRAFSCLIAAQLPWGERWQLSLTASCTQPQFWLQSLPNYHNPSRDPELTLSSRALLNWWPTKPVRENTMAAVLNHYIWWFIMQQ